MCVYVCVYQNSYLNGNERTFWAGPHNFKELFESEIFGFKVRVISGLGQGQGQG